MPRNTKAVTLKDYKVKIKDFKLNLNESQLLIELKEHFPNATNNEIKYKEPCKQEICHIETKGDEIVCVPGKRIFEQSIIEKTKEALVQLILNIMNCLLVLETQLM